VHASSDRLLFVLPRPLRQFFAQFFALSFPPCRSRPSQINGGPHTVCGSALRTTWVCSEIASMASNSHFAWKLSLLGLVHCGIAKPILRLRGRGASDS